MSSRLSTSPGHGLCVALTLVLALGPCPSAPAQDQPTAPTPRQLTDADAQLAKRLSETIDQLRRAGKFDQAIAPAREILGTCEKALGPDHWMTADARRDIEMLEHVAGLPEEGRRALASVGALEDRFSRLNQEGRYPEAERVVRDLVSIQERWLGADHLDTALSYNNLASLLYSQARFEVAEPLLRKALTIQLGSRGEFHPQTAAFLTNLSTNLYAQRRTLESEAIDRRVLAILERTRGADHPDTLQGCNDLAAGLMARMKLVEAETWQRRALAGWERSGLGDSPEAARSCNDLAANLLAQGKIPSAEELFRRTLSIQLRFSKEDPNTLLCYDNLSVCLSRQGRYAEAESLIRRALSVRLKQGEDHPGALKGYRLLSWNLKDQGRPAEAEALIRKVLAGQLKALGPEDPALAESYSLLAMILGNRGNLPEAESLNQKALAIRLKTLDRNDPEIARSYLSLAAVTHGQARHAESEDLLRKSLAILTRGEADGARSSEVAMGYSYLGARLDAEGKHAEAEVQLRKALNLHLETLGRAHPDTAGFLANLAVNLDVQGKLEEAERNWALAVDNFERTRLMSGTTGLDRALKAHESPAFSLALARARLGRGREAWVPWETDLAHGLIDDISARQLRPLDAQQRLRESSLVGQLQVLEERMTRLVEKAGRTQDEDEQLGELRAEQVRLGGEWVDFQNTINRQYQAYAGKASTLEEIQKTLPSDSALVGWLDVGGHHWACVIRSDGDPVWVPTPGTGPDQLWTGQDKARPELLRVSLRGNSPGWRELAAAMASQRLTPLRPHLKGITHLIVLTSPALAGVPIDVLAAAEPTRSPGPTVSYAPSATMFARLSRPRNGPASLPRLLALGDPAFAGPEPGKTPPTPPEHGIALLAVLPNGNADLAGLKAGDVLLNYNGTDLKAASDLRIVPAEAGAGKIPIRYWRSGEVRNIELAAGRLGIQIDPRRKAADVLLAQRAAEEALEPLTRGATLERLPGTRREVEAIAALFSRDRATTLLGEQATESALQQMARNGDLKHYRFLHLATHGKANPGVAMSSALFLAPDPDPDRSADPLALDTDGRITAQQIVNTWDLDADLVVLSACETGLGRYAGGEGYLGFTQALFVKGARSVVLSQWEVPDNATTLLMDRFYANLLGRTAGLAGPMPRAESLREAKDWLRALGVTQAQAEMKRLGLDPGSGSRRGEKTGIKSAGEARPFEHPHYWAGFSLIGDPY